MENNQNNTIAALDAEQLPSPITWFGYNEDFDCYCFINRLGQMFLCEF